MHQLPEVPLPIDTIVENVVTLKIELSLYTSITLILYLIWMIVKWISKMIWIILSTAQGNRAGVDSSKGSDFNSIYASGPLHVTPDKLVAIPTKDNKNRGRQTLCGYFDEGITDK
ncbi:hypothetical protein FQA39_LY15950 [Lamprigera yunnana]|nr:hypothetical protein FQA39_LY15950 [Lamprigera yunnana]